MNSKKTLAIMFSIAIIFTFAFSSFAQEKKVDKKDLPKAVVESFHKSYPKAEIKNASKETEHGKTYYEIESVDGSVNRDVKYAENGELAELETTISFDEVPNTVKKSFKKNYPKAEVLKSEKVVEGKKTNYEFLIEENESKSEIVFNSNGKVVKVEKKNAEEDTD